MPGQHALVSPSAASIWMNCTRMPRFAEGFPETSSIFADEGTLCHTIAEKLFEYGTPYLPIEVWRRYKEHELYTTALYDHAIDFVSYCNSFIPKRDARGNGDPYKIYSEKRLTLTRWIPEGFGHGDVALVYGTTLHVFDLKYGKGVLVPYMNNKQTRIYSLGWLNELDMFYDIQDIHMHIYQPRMDNIGYDSITRAELLAWGREQLKPKAQLAFDGKGEFKPGDHCGFCRGRNRCKALHDYNVELAKMQFADPDKLTDADIAKVLERKSLFDKWIKGVAEYALDEALRNGVNWPGFKLVEGRADRIYSDEDKVADALNKNLYRKDVYKPKELIGLTEMKALIGSSYFKQYVEPLLIKPAGKPTLVKESDPRPVFNSATKDFSDPYIEDWMK